MRYLDRGTLRELLATRSLTLPQASGLIAQVASALDYAHAQGVIHRDIKPSNILLDRHGNAFVSDFGIARLVSTTGDGGQITGTGAIVGTPDYMSPEQAQGRAGVDGRADVYALGVLLFQMLTGRLPFDAEQPMAVLLQHLQAPVPSAKALNRELPAGIDELFAHALAKDPAERPPTAGLLASAFAALLRGSRRSSHTATTQVLEERAVGATPTPPPREQQRIVTVVAASAAEYVALVEEEEGAEAARAALQALWERGRATIARYGGQIITRGDHDVLVAWGVDTSHEHDTEQAIHAALAIQADLRARLGTRPSPDEPLPLAIGVHTGPALVTLEGPANTLAVSGRTITVAERLASQAEGAIRISHATFRQVRGVFDVTPDTPLKVRGSAEPLETYTVTGAKAEAFRVRPRWIEGLDTPLVGRAGELRVLQDAFLTVLEEGETQVVSIIGEAGLGKTRLLDSFDQWADLRPETYWIFTTQATEAGRPQPYAVVRGLLAFRFGIRDGEPPAEVQAKLEAGVAALLKAPDDATAQLIGHLAGFDLREAPHIRGLLSDPRQLHELARQRFLQFLARLCAVAPTVILLDDMQHADEASLELLGQLAERGDIPLLLVLAARPSFLEHSSSWVADRRVHQRVTLEPLDRRSSRELVKVLLAPLEELPKELRDLLVERSAGNPLYLEELVRMLLDERVIVWLSDERWRMEPGRLNQLAVPPTLYGLLLARLDTLLTPEQLTLQRASVLGQVFAGAPLLALDAADDTHLAEPQAPIGTLVSRGFLERRSDTPVPGEAAFAFSQALLRDLIYETLLDRRRRAFHLAFASWLAEHSPTGLSAALIAEHYERAGSREQAAHWHARAGHHARETYAVEAAIQRYQTALADLPDTPEATADRIACYEGLGEVQLSLARLADAAASYRLVAERAEAAGNPAAAARGWNGLAFVQDHALEFAESRQSALRGIALAEAAGATRELALGLFHQAWAEVRLDNIQAAFAIGQRAQEILARADEPATAARWSGLLGVIHEMCGDPVRAVHFQQEALAYYRRVGNLSEVSTQLNNLGSTANQIGDFATALIYLQEAQEVSRAIAAPVLEIYVLSNLGHTLNGLGDHAGAEGAVQHGIQLCEQSQMLIFSDFYCALSESSLRQGRVAEAIEAARQALDAARANEGPRELAMAQRSLGAALGSTTRPGDAVPCFEESARILTESDARAGLAHTLRAWAEHELQHGDASQGRELLARARVIFAELCLSHQLARTPLDLERGA